MKSFLRAPCEETSARLSRRERMTGLDVEETFAARQGKFPVPQRRSSLFRIKLEDAGPRLSACRFWLFRGFPVGKPLDIGNMSLLRVG